MKDDDNYHSIQMLPKHPAMQKIALFIVALFILIAFGLAFLPWQQTVTGYGKTIALSPNEREQTITAPIDGRLGKWFVHDGSQVEKGDKIVEIQDNDPNLLKRLSIEKTAIESRLNAMNKAVKTAKINVERQHLLYKEGISSRRKYEKAMLELNQYENKYADAQVDLTKVDTAIARQRMQVVRAAMSGTIIKRIPGEGTVLVKQGQQLANLVPKTQSRVVELLLNGNDIPLIRKNQEVRLQFEGWPAVQFSGWPSVAVGTFGGRVYLIDPVDNGKGMFRIIIVPDKNKDWPAANFLRQGVRVHGWVLLNQVPLWFELWRRFNAFPPSFDEAKPAQFFNTKPRK